MQSQGPPALQPGSLVDVALAGRLFMGPGFPQTTRASITRILNEQSFEVCVCVRACVRMCLCAVVSCACTLVRARTCVQRPRRLLSERADHGYHALNCLPPAQVCLALSQIHSTSMHPTWSTVLFVHEEHHLWKRVGECAARHCLCVHLCA